MTFAGLLLSGCEESRDMFVLSSIGIGSTIGAGIFVLTGVAGE